MADRKVLENRNENEIPIWKWNWGISDEKKKIVVCKTARRAHSQKLVKTQQCAVVAQREPEVPYQLVWDNRFCAFFPFDLGLTGHTWPASCRWWRGQNPRDTLERYLSAAFPVGVKPISVLPRLFPPEKKMMWKVVGWWLVCHVHGSGKPISIATYLGVLNF